MFARESVLRGSFDKYAETSASKRGTAEVDDAFLQQIEGWREALAHNLALRNPGLTTRELNFAVQRTIDRLIFLRICEDRAIDEPNRLQGLLNGGRIYERLVEVYREADARFNSGLFHFDPTEGLAEPADSFTPGLTIDDKLLKEIIGGLYYPESPYVFSVFPADILGQVYEQFLGKVIRLTPGHQAKVEDKPEVKKAGGVFYTPTYIVDYIVRGTLGKLLEGKTPRQVAGANDGRPLRLVDPACGSGSFLIGAYQYLLDWHRDWYVEHLVPLLGEGKGAAPRGGWRAAAPAPSTRRPALGSRGRCALARVSGSGRRLAADDCRAQAHPAGAHLRRRRRRAGRRGDQDVAAAEGAGGRERRHALGAAQPVSRARAARPGGEHQVRELAGRAGLLRRRADEPAARRRTVPHQRLRLAGGLPAGVRAARSRVLTP